VPFKDFDATAMDSYHIEDPDGLLQDTDRLKKILDAKYIPADLEKLCQSQSQLQQALVDVYLYVYSVTGFTPAVYWVFKSIKHLRFIDTLGTFSHTKGKAGRRSLN
jgi:hypothetical protein